MNYFVIMIEVSELLILSEQSKGEIWGCFCTRYIKDNNIDSAIAKAKALVLSELHESGVLCIEKQLFIESVKEIAEKPDDVADKGFTFYPIDNSNQH